MTLQRPRQSRGPSTKQGGRVIAVNPGRATFIVEIDGGDFAVFELIDSVSISIGDEVQGNLEALGSEQLVHLTTRKAFSAFGQSGPSSRAACDRLL